MQNKHKLKKLVSLLKSAQNEPFIKLVMGNLAAELTLGGSAPPRPDKVLKLTKLLVDGVLTCQDRQMSREFCRLYFTEALVQFLGRRTSSHAYFEQSMLKVATAIMNNNEGKSESDKSKSAAFFERYNGFLLFDLQEMQAQAKLESRDDDEAMDMRDATKLFNVVELKQLLADDSLSKNKTAGQNGNQFGQAGSNLECLMNECRELLRDRIKEFRLPQQSPPKVGTHMSQPTMASTTVEESSTRKFKLSSLVDKKFAVEANGRAVSGKVTDRVSVNVLLRTLEELNGHCLIPEIAALTSTKRMKTDDGKIETKEVEGSFLFLSPVLAILLHYARFLTAEQWVQRQVAACGLSALLEASATSNFSLDYAIINKTESTYRVQKTASVSADLLLGNILTRALVVMLRDQFKDNEDITVLVPVRSQAMRLIAAVSPRCQADQLQRLLQSLPLLLTVCENDSNAIHSFFMVLKGLISEKEALFEMFGRSLLVECIIHVDDSVKVVVTQLIREFLDMYFDVDQGEAMVSAMLTNLTLALKQTDDIEGSCLHVFNLISDILSHDKFKAATYCFDSKVFFPFNFHRVVRVRTTLHRLLNCVLRRKSLELQRNDLFDLHTLLVQSIIMEDDETLLRVAKANLALVVRELIADGQLKDYVKSYLSSYLLMPERFQEWFQCRFLAHTTEWRPKSMNFDKFLFFEAECFEPIHGGYWSVVHEPVGKTELQAFYYKKLEACLSVLSIVAAEAGLERYLTDFLSMDSRQGFFNHQRLMLLMFKEKLSRSGKQKMVDAEAASEVGVTLAAAQAGRVSVLDFEDLSRLEQRMGATLKTLGSRGPAVGWLCGWMHQTAQHVAEARQSAEQVTQEGQPSPEQGTSAALINHLQQSLDHAINHVKDLSQARVLDARLSASVSETTELLGQLLCECERTAELFKSFTSSQHMREVLRPAADGQPATAMHPKLNDIIYPVWNQLTEQTCGFYQDALARILSLDMLPCQAKCGKVRSRDAVIAMVLNALAQAPLERHSSEATTLGNGAQIDQLVPGDMSTADVQKALQDAEKGSDDQTMGCERVLQEWLKLGDNARYEFFAVYQSNTVADKLANELENAEQTQHFINLSARMTCALLHGDVKGTMTVSFMSSLQTIVNRVGQILEWMQYFEHFDLLYQRLFCLIEVERQKHKTAELTQLATELAIHLLAALQAGSLPAFATLHRMLTTCIEMTSNIQQQKDQSDESKLPAYMRRRRPPSQAELCPAELHRSFVEVYLRLFVLPVIKYMGAAPTNTACLGMIIQLLPLAKDELRSTLQSLPEQLAWVDQVVADSESFLAFFTQAEMKAQLQMIVQPSSELRDYQRQGIEWLITLGRYGLNCALCDDMGLGKTIQSLTVVLNEMEVKRQQGASKGQPNVSLVVCPNSLTFQWFKEIGKFFDHLKVRARIYDNSTRDEILSDLGSVDIIITSYEKARSDIMSGQQQNRMSLADIDFFYVVLDEGHRIKAAKSKLTLAVKSLRAERKLVLTGTPLQNRVAELWSIFDFLMPGFLEEEKVFNSRYSQHLSSGMAKLSEKPEETQAFLQALKSLKKRIQPFILRRTKADVLKDLPPKFIQDFECEMGPVQRLFFDIADTRYPILGVTNDNTEQKDKNKGAQVFRNLIVHRRVINHPLLAADALQQYLDKKQASVMQQIGTKPKKTVEYSAQELSILDTSTKLRGLVDLLRECGIIDDNNSNEQQIDTKKKKETAEQPEQDMLTAFDDDEMANFEEAKDTLEAGVAEGHRALIFCQMTSYLNMVVEHVLKPFGVKHTQLLSQHNNQERFDIVEQYNADPTIKVLIMTTAVGGLGLNLTGADTVIFMEHDWNPMKDMQAIDRAHRIGQKRRVNVYRLIARETLEEKILGLQRFKQNLEKCLIQARGVGGEGALGASAQLQVHDLLGCFEDHSAVEQQAQGLDKASKQTGQVGMDSYEDKVYDDIEGGNWSSEFLDKM